VAARRALMPYFGEDEKWRETYAELVRDGIATAEPIWRGLRRNIFPSSEQWLESVKQHMKVSRHQADIPQDQRAACRPVMTRIVKTIAAKLGVTTSVIQDQHGGRWRELVALLGVHEGMRRLRVIAQTLRLRSCSRVTQLGRSCERRLRTDAELRRLVSTLQLALS
jgi:hypothetical protein